MTTQPPAYAFNDATGKWEPTIVSSFSWGGSNWVSPFYSYAPTTGWWHVIPAVTPSSAINALTAGSGDPAALLNSILGGSSSNSTTGPGSTNSNTLTTDQALLDNLMLNGGIFNNDTSLGTSGDASVSGNTSAGNAVSGAVSVVTNLLNLLNAMWTFSGTGLSYFVDNIMGNQTGDVTITPQTSTITAPAACLGGLASNSLTGPDSTNTASQNCNSNIDVNAQTNANIVNNVNLNAQSGNASVTGNTLGGSATSGNATAELNILNLIDTAIGSSNSFFGIINIYGNLDGDILFPTLGLNGAVASGTGEGTSGNNTTGPNSNNTTSTTNTDTTNINNNVNGSFNNNINLAANSGDASVTNNTAAGSATTGSATTNSSLFNLFYTDVFANNAVLVIVNDMGNWVGQLLDLPGSNSSEGGLLTSDGTVQNATTGPNSNNTASTSNTNTTNLNNTVNGSITNNVTAKATTGSASVSDNTQGGNATSGNASVSSDIANIFGSALSIGHTFGVLFINVFGSWNGSVGVNTVAGTTTPGSGSAAPSVAAAAPLVSLVQAVAGGHGFASSLAGGSGTGSGGDVSATSPTATTLNAVKAAAVTPQAAAKAAASTTGLLTVLAAATMLLAGGAASLERKLRR